MKNHKEYYSSVGQTTPREEADEAENYEHNKKVMRGHAEDSRFDEGSTKHSGKIVRTDHSMYSKGKRFFEYLKGK